MESSSWNVNPADILNNAVYSNGVPPGNNLMSDNAKLQPEDSFQNYLDLGYQDMDNVLTQKLNNLEVPMVPDFTQNGLDTLDFGTDFDWNNLQIEEPSLRSNEQNMKNPKDHKRGMSGTAIFGFANHNKQLSISSVHKGLNFEVNNSSSNKNQRNFDGESKQPFDNGNMMIGQKLLKQQEELKMALDKQKEMNRQLEQQLLENRKQQEQLQNALQQQEIVTHRLVTHTPTHSPSRHEQTPRSSRITEDNSILVTSNSKSGKYQFPAPPNPPHMMVSPPMSNTSYNGSPSHGHRKRSFISGFQSNNESDLLRLNNCQMYDYSKEAYTPPVPNDLLNIDPKRTNMVHYKKESTFSTTSTIPQFNEEEASDTEYSNAIGLGIQVDGNLKQNKMQFSKAQKVDILPTITGSAHNTPVKVIPPQKHTFQHTPTKQQQHQQISGGNYANNSRTTGDEFVVGSQPVNIFANVTKTPQLKPPSSRAELNLSPESDAYRVTPSNSPGVQFKVFETPSPSVRQDRDLNMDNLANENKEESVVNLDNTPMKITRKPTTLPRGSIDIYVKELPDKVFECLYPDCHKLFKRRYNIRSHIQTHLEDRPYICDYQDCQKSFVRNHDLIRHRKRHAERNFVCSCGMKFAKQDSLDIHKSKMICSGGKAIENSVTKKSPKKYFGYSANNGNRLPNSNCNNSNNSNNKSITNSPVKEAVRNEATAGYVIKKMEQQLKQDIDTNGFLTPPPPIGRESVDNLNRSPQTFEYNSNIDNTNNNRPTGNNLTSETLMSPPHSTGLSDLGSPFLRYTELPKTIG